MDISCQISLFPVNNVCASAGKKTGEYNKINYPCIIVFIYIIYYLCYFVISSIPQNSVYTLAKLNCRTVQCRNLLWNLGLLEYLTGEEDWNLEHIIYQTANCCPHLPGRGPGRAVMFITAVVTAKVGTVRCHRPPAMGREPEGKEFYSCVAQHT